MDAQYLGRIHFQTALTAQDQAHADIIGGRRGRFILGFESEPVVTLGVRGNPALDLNTSADDLARRGFALVQLDRGGQATLHHPGQLVIFPMCPVARGTLRAWLLEIVEVTRRCLASWQIHADWDESRPGLYTRDGGKIMALGVRLRKGVTTHGLAINVSNDLADYAVIRPCGMANAKMAHMGPGIELRLVFEKWLKLFNEGHS